MRIPIGKSLGPGDGARPQLRARSRRPDGSRAGYLAEADDLGEREDRPGDRARRALRRAAGGHGCRGKRRPRQPRRSRSRHRRCARPTASRVAVDAKGVVSGGGFLFHDRAQALYAGVMQLTLQERFTLKAFGLLAHADARRQPGLLADRLHHRRGLPALSRSAWASRCAASAACSRSTARFDEEAMREGLKNDTLGTLLFPQGPDPQRARDHPQPGDRCFPARDGQLPVRAAREDRLVRRRRWCCSSSR